MTIQPQERARLEHLEAAYQEEANPLARVDRIAEYVEAAEVALGVVPAPAAREAAKAVGAELQKKLDASLKTAIIALGYKTGGDLDEAVRMFVEGEGGGEEPDETEYKELEAAFKQEFKGGGMKSESNEIEHGRPNPNRPGVQASRRSAVRQDHPDDENDDQFWSGNNPLNRAARPRLKKNGVYGDEGQPAMSEADEEKLWQAMKTIYEERHIEKPEKLVRLAYGIAGLNLDIGNSNIDSHMTHLAMEFLNQNGTARPDNFNEEDGAANDLGPAKAAPARLKKDGTPGDYFRSSRGQGGGIKNQQDNRAQRDAQPGQRYRFQQDDQAAAIPKPPDVKPKEAPPAGLEWQETTRGFMADADLPSGQFFSAVVYHDKGEVAWKIDVGTFGDKQAHQEGRLAGIDVAKQWVETKYRQAVKEHSGPGTALKEPEQKAAGARVKKDADDDRNEDFLSLARDRADRSAEERITPAGRERAKKYDGQDFAVKSWYKNVEQKARELADMMEQADPNHSTSDYKALNNAAYEQLERIENAMTYWEKVR